GRADLGEDLDAVRVLLDHALEAANLTFDALQPLEVVVLVYRVTTHYGVPPFVVDVRTGGVARCRGGNRRNRRLFDTTNRLEHAIAAAAINGLSNPNAAIGNAATLWPNARK